MFAKFLGETKTLYDVKNSERILAFLDTRRKSKEEDPEQKWIITWNDYLWRLKMFYRWLYNVNLKRDGKRNYYDVNIICLFKICLNHSFQFLFHFMISYKSPN